MKFPELRPRAPMAGLALAAAFGVALADRWETPLLWDLAGVAIFAAIAFRWSRTPACWLLVASAFFTVHAARRHGSEAAMLSEQFVNGPRVVRISGIVWDEPQKPKKWSPYTTCHFPMKLESIEIGERSTRCNAVMQIRWNGPPPDYGDRVSVLGSAANLAVPRNPGEFDLAGYQSRRGIFDEVRARYAADCKLVDHEGGSRIWKSALATRHWIQKQLTLDLEDAPRVSALITSLVLGMRNDTPEDLRELLQATGTVHIFAVSGVTVTMLTLFLVGLLKIFGVPRRFSALAVILILIGYAFVTGLATSTVRAAIMASVFLGAALFDRPAVTYNSLGAAALLILALDTNQLFLTGFQFSFGVVFVVILLTGRIKRRLEPFAQPDPFLPRALWTRTQHARSYLGGKLVEGISVSMASWIGSLPFTAGYFHLVAPASIAANVLAVPISFVILALGVASAMAAFFSPGLAMTINNANGCCAHLLLRVLELFAHLPCSYTYVGPPQLSRESLCRVSVLAIGTGEAIHMRAGSANWLIDCGHGYEYDHMVLPYLRSRGVNGLDGLALTVGNVQHIGGAIAALSDLRPRVILESALKDRSTARRDFHAALAARNLAKCIVQRGDVLQLSPHAALRVLYPPTGIQRSAAEDKALVLMLDAEGGRVLFTSSSGFFTEQWLLENEPNLHADILVKGAHGKDLSGTPEFLERVHPQAIVYASSSRFGSPDSEAPDASPPSGDARVFRQEQSGAVLISLRPDEIRLEGFLNHQIFRSRAR